MPITKQFFLVKWIEILIYCVILHPKPNTWVVSLSIIFVKMLFFASLSNKFFYELVWIFKNCVALHLWPNTWLVVLGMTIL